MENVYFYVAIAAFVLAAVLAVAAVVVFVKMDVINAIRFLQGKRVPTSGEGARRRAARGSRGAGAKKSNPARSVLGGPEGDDRVTDIAHEGPEGDDNMTTVVAPISDEPASARRAAHAAQAEKPVRDENDDEGFAGSETPTEVLTEDDLDTERPTGVLVEDEEDSERPTGVLTEDEEDSERPTGVLTEDEEDSERPTGVLVEDDEESERSTGLLVEEDEESERETGLLDEADEDSEQETGLLDEGAEASEFETDVLSSGDVYENIDAEGVAQHEDDGFRFILKQNVIVVHTDESLDRVCN